MNRIRTIRFVVVIGCATLTTQAGAQNLADFVNDPATGATDLQVQTGNAVQRTCGVLGSHIADGTTLPSAGDDLFLRCNEMVQTAIAIQDPTGQRPSRDLGLDSDQLLAAVQNVSGEEMFSQSTLSTRATNAQFSNIAGRLNAIRAGGTSAGAGGRVAFSDPYTDPNQNLPGYNRVSLSGGGAAGDYEVAGSRWGWFVEGSFNTGDRDQTANEDGFDFDATSFTGGIDYMLNSGVVGVSIGVDNYDADFQTNALVNGGSVKLDSTSGSVFGAFYNNNWYFDGILTVANLETDTTRRAFYPSPNAALCPAMAPCPGEDDTLLGTADGDYFAGGATIGYDANRGNWDITTALSLAYRDIDIDGYTEVDPNGGGLTLSYDKQNVKSLKSILGVSFSRAFSRDFGILSPYFRAEWHHEFEDDLQSLLAKYSVEELLADQGLGGAAAGVFSLNPAQCFSCFQVLSDGIDTDFGLLGVGLSAVFSQRIQLYGVFDFLVGADNLTSNNFAVGLRGQF
jgi:uncharacterized protein with beta-barrel porin domain